MMDKFILFMIFLWILFIIIAFGMQCYYGVIAI